ncbi:hypothetical protein SmJEL517_g01425 [Synchytrium microbalum]|uniref:MYND-type domain-containing protein n=1 Tax=Synchytrium microbalum TaxID=1806994 RepID=A0A507C5L4_9FUNG|nr:uncharacterized protein SmJEL517_g01425 [Synchytrium microbalum]TPX36297.1 hypothetical protein SmJEL517_g01425 [Synchytrium microbalum]
MANKKKKIDGPTANNQQSQQQAIPPQPNTGSTTTQQIHPKSTSPNKNGGLPIPAGSTISITATFGPPKKSDSPASKSNAHPNSSSSIVTGTNSLSVKTNPDTHMLHLIGQQAAQGIPDPVRCSFACQLCHAANVLDRSHKISRYSNFDAFGGMEQSTPMSTEWIDTKKDMFTLGNGMVILPGSKYKRVTGSLGVGVKVQGMILAGTVDIQQRSPPQPCSSSSASASTSPVINRRGVIVNVLESQSPTPYRIHTFDMDTQVGYFLTMNPSSYLDSDLVLVGPFQYRGVNFGHETVIHADGIFGRIHMSTSTSLEVALGRNVNQKQPTRTQTRVYTEMCIDRMLNAASITLPSDDLSHPSPWPPGLNFDCFGYHNTCLPHSFSTVLRRHQDALHPNTRDSDAIIQAELGRRCAFCGIWKLKEKLQLCGRCRTVFYCTRKCQMDSWKAGHKRLCIDKSLVGHPPGPNLTTPSNIASKVMDKLAIGLNDCLFGTGAAGRPLPSPTLTTGPNKSKTTGRKVRVEVDALSLAIATATAAATQLGSLSPSKASSRSSVASVD